jgi:tRNA-specific 2-thiouridylase
MRDSWMDLAPGTRLVVAMSGGVDSSVAAALLVERGMDVIGITMKNFCYADVPLESAAAACCSIEAIEDARAVARRMDVPHHVLDFEGPFREAVMDPFVAEYAAGRTPNPCVRCNRFVRFPQLWRKARLLGAEAVATGHYARAVRNGTDEVELLRPTDRAKDQTFYLWGLIPSLLERAVFPLGGLTKDEVRDKARALGLEVADKRESQDICFIPDGDLRGFLDRYREEWPDVAGGERFRPGPIRTLAGATIGEHPGSGFFTVGQRRGLALAGQEEPLYVVAIEKENTVVVGTERDLDAPSLEAEEMNWLVEPAGGGELRAGVQIRYRSAAAPARVVPLPDRAARIHFDVPQRAIAPGQSVVLYDGDRVLGGGTIARALR